MFYEEAVIDGVLQFRTTPDGEWRKVGAESLTAMLMASRAAFPESDAIDDELCPSCGSDSLFEREVFTDEKLIALARQRLAMDRA